MAAYLVGSRGTALHAVGLGLSVTLSHTIGILALAAVVIGAQGVLAARRGRADRADRGRGLDRRDRRLDADQRGPAAAVGGRRLGCRGRARPRPRTTHDHDPHEHDHAERTTTRTRTTTPHAARARARARLSRARRRRPHAPAAGRLDHHVAEPVRPRPGGRADPLDERAADPPRLDRRGPAGFRLRPRGRLRARHGARHGRRRRGARVRPRPARAVRRRVVARSRRAPWSRSPRRCSC